MPYAFESYFKNTGLEGSRKTPTSRNRAKKTDF